MAVINVVEVYELFIRLCMPSLLLITALVQDCDKPFCTYVCKPFILIWICYFSSYNLRVHTMVNTLPSYLLGFLTIWILILSFVFLICCVPSRDLVKINIYLGDQIQPTYQIDKFPIRGPLWRRIPWMLELLVSARGIGWNYSVRNVYRTRTGGLSAPTYPASSKLPYRLRANKVRSVFLRRHLWTCGVDYLLVEICTHLMYHDSFLSGAESSNPFFLPWVDCFRWFALLPYRLVVAGVGVYTVIDLASRAIALVSVGVFGEKWLGSWGQYWNYPPMFGSLHSIWERGLAGFWGEFWHPVFRFGLTSITKTIIPIPSPTNPPTSSTSISIKRLLRLLVALTLSGLMHAAGSCTLASSMPTPLLTRTYPYLTLLAFILQVPGIAMQQFLFHYFSPPPAHETAFKVKMLVFTCVWGLCTMSLIIADFAAGQLFKIPFLPVSVVDLVLWGGRLIGNETAPSLKAVIP